MCGTTLGTKAEIRRPAAAGANVPTNRPLEMPSFSRAPQSQNVDTARPVAGTSQARTQASGAVANSSTVSTPIISGPSMLGLDVAPVQANAHVGSSALATEDPRHNDYGPTPDLLREKSFSGLDSFFEPEKPKGGAGRLILFLLLLAALGAAGWWTYTNYLATTGMKPAPSTPNTTETSDQTNAPAQNQQTPQQTTNAAPAATPQSSAPAQETTQGQAAAAQAANQSESAVGNAATPAATAVAPAPSAAAAREEARRKAREQAREQAQAEAEARRQQRLQASAKPAPTRPSAVAAAEAPAIGGDADFRKGEAYLYGRGAAQNCEQAVRYLKSASAAQSAKARSTFGTMYATGHCVARDLPTSYQWFALALQIDPNNKILQSDLNAIWNQMTPPERQSATRAKQQ
jgi:cytoskeletal protein RodZ